MTYLVLHVRDYSFKDDDGRQVEGATVTYLDLSLPPAEGEQGYAPMQLSVNKDTAKGFTVAPAFYTLDFAQRRGRNGKPQLVLHSARLEAPAALDELLIAR